MPAILHVAPLRRRGAWIIVIGLFAPLIRQSTVQTGAGLTGGGELSAGGRAVGGRARAYGRASSTERPARRRPWTRVAIPRRSPAPARGRPAELPPADQRARSKTSSPPTDLFPSPFFSLLLLFPPEAARACNSRINGGTSSSSSTCAGERRRVPRTGPAGEDRDPAPSAKRRTTGTPILRAAPHLLTANTNFPALLIYIKWPSNPPRLA